MATILRTTRNFLALFLIASATSISYAQIPFVPNSTEVARSGQTVPDLNGQFSSFLDPSINSVGTIVFNARLFNTAEGNLDDSGIYRYFTSPSPFPTINSIDQVVRENETYSIGGSNYTIADVFLASTKLENPQLSGVAPVTGQFSALAFTLTEKGGNPLGNTLIAVEDSQGNFQRVAQAGEDVPNGNGTFREFNIFSVSDISANGGVNFFSSLDDTAGGDTDNTAIYRYQPDGSLTEIVRRGDPVSGGAFTAVGSIRSNDLGGAAFLGVDDSGDPATDTAVYRLSSTANSFRPGGWGRRFSANCGCGATTVFPRFSDSPEQRQQRGVRRATAR